MRDGVPATRRRRAGARAAEDGAGRAPRVTKNEKRKERALVETRDAHDAAPRRRRPSRGRARGARRVGPRPNAARAGMAEDEVTPAFMVVELAAGFSCEDLSGCLDENVLQHPDFEWLARRPS